VDFKQQLIIELLKAIPFLIIGLITGYIAYRQYMIEKSRLAKDLYQARKEIYNLIIDVDTFIHHSGFEDKQFLEPLMRRNRELVLSDYNFVYPKSLCQKLEVLLPEVQIFIQRYLTDSFSKKEFVDSKSNLGNKFKSLMEMIIEESRIKK
jgi:hypothetical protein